MANLTEIASRHKVNLVIKEKPNTHPTVSFVSRKPEGRLRRPWLMDEEENLPKKETGFKQGLNSVKTVFINPVETRSKQEENRVDQPCFKIGSKQGFNRVKDFRGNPLLVMSFLVKNISSEMAYVTEQLSMTNIANGLGISRESTKTALKFLIKNNIVMRLNSRTGLHGWTNYKLKESLVDEFVKQGLNRVKTGANSSSNIYNNTNTTRYEENKDFHEMIEIDISPLAEIGFSEYHLKQILSQKKLSSDLIQHSIHAFAFDLRENDKEKHLKAKKIAPLNFIMGILRNGIPYTPPPNYESPEIRAMRLFVENQEKMRSEQEKIEKKAFDLAVNEWIANLKEIEKSSILTSQEEKNQWLQCLKFFENEYDKKFIDTWITPLNAVEENGKWTIFSPNDFVKNELNEKFSSTFEKFLGKFFIEVGRARANQDSAFSAEVRELRKYFRENLWETKRQEIFLRK